MAVVKKCDKKLMQSVTDVTKKSCVLNPHKRIFHTFDCTCTFCKLLKNRKVCSSGDSEKAADKFAFSNFQVKQGLRKGEVTTRFTLVFFSDVSIS